MRTKLLIGIAISALCLYFAFKGLSLKEVGSAMREADLRWILCALAIYACGFFTRARRWEVLMKPIKPIPFTLLLRPMVIGFFANNVLPFRMGELVRAHVTGQKFGISRTASLGTIVLERIFDTIAFLGIFLAVALFFPFPSGVKNAAYAMGAGCLLLITALFLGSKHHVRTHVLIERLPLSPPWRIRIKRVMTDFTSGVSGMMHGPYVAQALLWSLAVWTVEGSTVYFVARAFPIHVTYAQAYFVLFFLGLSVTLPQAPGYVGTVELFGTTALSLLGIPKEQGLPVILTLHGCQFTFIAVLGLWALSKEHLSLSRLMTTEKQAAQADL